jgi:nucleoside-diphosphate-sugar epimerase
LARAYRAALERPVSGAFNIAAQDVIQAGELSRLFNARTMSLPPIFFHAGLAAAWRMRVVKAPADLFDAFMRIPVMSTARARIELDWTPEHTAFKALSDMVEGAREQWGSQTPPLDPD